MWGLPCVQVETPSFRCSGRPDLIRNQDPESHVVKPDIELAPKPQTQCSSGFHKQGTNIVIPRWMPCAILNGKGEGEPTQYYVHVEIRAMWLKHAGERTAHNLQI